MKTTLYVAHGASVAILRNSGKTVVTPDCSAHWFAGRRFDLIVLHHLDVAQVAECTKNLLAHVTSPDGKVIRSGPLYTYESLDGRLQAHTARGGVDDLSLSPEDAVSWIEEGVSPTNDTWTSIEESMLRDIVMEWALVLQREGTWPGKPLVDDGTHDSYKTVSEYEKLLDWSLGAIERSGK